MIVEGLQVPAAEEGITVQPEPCVGGLFDTHVHLDDEKFACDQAEVVERMHSAGISRCINVGADLPSSRRSVEIAASREGIWAAVGVHPHEAEDFLRTADAALAELRELTKNRKVVAVGEIGLDYYYDHSPRDAQKEAFQKQLELAREERLPILLHVRDAHGDALAVLRKYGAPQGGVIHCFTGSYDLASEYLRLGLHVAIGGAVTFKNANKLLETVRRLPDDRLLLETDCPYMAPVPMRGKRNEPAFLRYTAEAVALLRGCSVASLAENTARNAASLFGISDTVSL